MTEFCFSTPRIIMQRCFASTTTATPAGCRAFISASAIWMVRCSWICRRRAKTSTIRATLESPITLPFGNIGDMRPADKRQQMMFAHRVKLDVFDQNDLARVGIEDRAVNDLIEILPITLREKLKGARRASPAFSARPSPMRILARSLRANSRNALHS